VRDSYPAELWRRPASRSAGAALCRPCVRKDCCKRVPVGDCCNPSTVVMSCPATCPAATRQAQTGSPSRELCSAAVAGVASYFGPGQPRSSRNTRERRCDGELDTTTLRPLTENAIVPVSTSACNSRVVAIQAASTQASSARRTRVKEASRRYSAEARTSSIGESGARWSGVTRAPSPSRTEAPPIAFQ